MTNMSYCRFRNTLSDLQDCYENMEEKISSEEEKRAKKDLIALCKEIADIYDEEEDEDEK